MCDLEIAWVLLSLRGAHSSGEGTLRILSICTVRDEEILPKEQPLGALFQPLPVQIDSTARAGSLSESARKETSALALIVLSVCSPLRAQQKGQWMSGQVGLNAGILPSPGFTAVNMDINYSAGTFNDRNGNAVPVTGSYNVWVVETLLYFVPNTKFLGGNIGFMIVQPTGANGSLTVTQFGLGGGGYGFTDTFVQPFGLGWHLKRADIQVGDAFMIPTGRYAPGATNNIGSGYFGNHFMTGTTVYLTKNKGTSVNLFTDWEVHGQKQSSATNYVTPGQAFTDEWGFGQVLPLDKQFTKLIQLGVVGYDQWQVTADSGTLAGGLPAGRSPFYSVHAVGGQADFILPAKNIALFFKYEHEYKSYSHSLGNTIVFGGSWTLRIPKPTPPAH
jgi:hypothetical protein